MALSLLAVLLVFLLDICVLPAYDCKGHPGLSGLWKNPEKTESGKYISTYECDAATVTDEFLLAKASCATTTSREWEKANDQLYYQVRLSFHLGKITSKEANRIRLSVKAYGVRGYSYTKDSCPLSRRPCTADGGRIKPLDSSGSSTM